MTVAERWLYLALAAKETLAANGVGDDRAAVVYKRRGGASSADELVAYLDFGGDVTSTSGPFAVTVSTPITLQN